MGMGTVPCYRRSEPCVCGFMTRHRHHILMKIWYHEKLWLHAHPSHKKGEKGAKSKADKTWNKKTARTLQGSNIHLLNAPIWRCFENNHCCSKCHKLSEANKWILEPCRFCFISFYVWRENSIKLWITNKIVMKMKWRANGFYEMIKFEVDDKTDHERHHCSFPSKTRDQKVDTLYCQTNKTALKE